MMLKLCVVVVLCMLGCRSPAKPVPPAGEVALTAPPLTRHGAVTCDTSGVVERCWISRPSGCNTCTAEATRVGDGGTFVVGDGWACTVLACVQPMWIYDPSKDSTPPARLPGVP